MAPEPPGGGSGSTKTLHICKISLSGEGSGRAAEKRPKSAEVCESFGVRVRRFVGSLDNVEFRGGPTLQTEV